MIDEEALDKAYREEIAQRWKTNGPRTLDEYASPEIMASHRRTARTIISEYLKNVNTQKVNQKGWGYSE